MHIDRFIAFKNKRKKIKNEQNSQSPEFKMQSILTNVANKEARNIVL